MKRDCVIYIHGRGGGAEESAHYEPLFERHKVIGLGYSSEDPRLNRREIYLSVNSAKEKYGGIILIANSIGAFFAMNAGIDRMIDRAYFISPVVDMEKLITDMMARAGISEEELEQKQIIKTSSGEELSQKYLRYVRSRPVSWSAPTEILYGERDFLTPLRTVAAFAKAHNAGLTVMKDGEHWFHTDEQMKFLDKWILDKEKKFKMDNNGIVIRPELPADHREVETLIRESFWNVYRPGALEHFVIHILRGDPAFVKELDFVMEKDGRLIGQNMFMKTVINADDGRVIDVLTMGPICIANDLKRQGYGKLLLDYSLEKAAALGYGAVLFEGNIKFYGKCGFDYSRKFGIRYHDLPEGADSSFFLCRELIPGYLDGITGVYQTPRGYYVDRDAAEEFDKSFPPMEKLKLPGQLE